MGIDSGCCESGWLIETYVDTAMEGSGGPLERPQRRFAAASLQPGNNRLSGSHPIGKLALSESLRLPEYTDLATNLICETCVIVSRASRRTPQALIPDLGPTLVLSNLHSAVCPSLMQRRISASARLTSAVSRDFVLRKTVRSTIRRPGAMK